MAKKSQLTPKTFSPKRMTYTHKTRHSATHTHTHTHTHTQEITKVQMLAHSQAFSLTHSDDLEYVTQQDPQGGKAVRMDGITYKFYTLQKMSVQNGSMQHEVLFL